MSYDNSEAESIESLMMRAPRRKALHSFHATRSSTPRPGKDRMYDAVEKLIKEYRQPQATVLRFMSLPGMDWKFENRIHKSIPAKVLHTGFERDENVILRGAVNVPRASSDAKVTGFRQVSVEAMPGVNYFKTNRARWLHLDANDALTLTPACFQASSKEERLRWYNYWLQKFCMWDAVWLDYYSPPLDKIAMALNNLHFHCNPELDQIPVAVTLSKARTNVRYNESLGALLQDKEMGRHRWLEFQLGGGNTFPFVKFETLDFIEYNDTSPMCSILGLIKR